MSLISSPPRAIVDFSALLLVAGLGFGAVLQLRAWAFRDDPGLLHNNPLLEDLIDDHRGGDLIHIIVESSQVESSRVESSLGVCVNVI